MWCGSSAPMAFPVARGGTDHEPGRHSRSWHATGGQGRARGGGAARPAAPGHTSESAHLGHAHGRPVGRRARGHDLVIAATSARRRRADRALQRGSSLEVRGAGWPAFGLLQAAEGAGAGAAAAGRSRPCHREGAAAGDTHVCATGPRPGGRSAQGSRSGSGFLGVLPFWYARQDRSASECASGWPGIDLGGLRPAGRWAGLDGCPACRPDRRAEPARPERGFPERRFYGNPQFRQSANADLAVPGDGRDGDRRGAGDRHQV